MTRKTKQKIDLRKLIPYAKIAAQVPGFEDFTEPEKREWLKVLADPKVRYRLPVLLEEAGFNDRIRDENPKLTAFNLFFYQEMARQTTLEADFLRITQRYEWLAELEAEWDPGEESLRMDSVLAERFVALPPAVLALHQAAVKYAYRLKRKLDAREYLPATMSLPDKKHLNELRMNNFWRCIPAEPKADDEL